LSAGAVHPGDGDVEGVRAAHVAGQGIADVQDLVWCLPQEVEGETERFWPRFVGAGVLAGHHQIDLNAEMTHRNLDLGAVDIRHDADRPRGLGQEGHGIAVRRRALPVREERSARRLLIGS